jgi:hypothetical protein
VEAKTELIGKRLVQVKQINNAIQNANLNKNPNIIKSRMKYSLK